MTGQAEDIYLEDLIAENYDDVFDDVLDHKHSQYIFKGGRGSLKSSFIGFAIITLMLMPGNEGIHAVAFRKTAKTLRDSVYAQLVFAINMMGLANEFDCHVSPMKITRKSTGQTILFRGLDDASKIKSIKVTFGYIGITWFEEADTFTGMKEIRSVLQSCRRGGDVHWCFMSFNPPETRANFMNEEVLIPQPDRLVHSSTYLTVPPEWLGKQFFEDAEQLKEVNPEAYRHEYLGEVTGTGGEVFNNLRIEEIPQDVIDKFANIYMGIDWGWYPDPYQWVKMCYDPARLTLYIYDSYRTTKTSNANTWKYLKEHKGVTDSDLITADSAEPKSVSDYREYGSLCRGAIKGPDSVRYGIKWLQSLKAIVIDPVRCPEVAEEFEHYEYERDSEGNVVSGYPDANNHSIDATRYAMERVYKRKGQ